MQLRGTLRGHNGWVTQIATNPIHTDMILSCSRGEYLSQISLHSLTLLIRVRNRSRQNRYSCVRILTVLRILGICRIIICIIWPDFFYATDKTLIVWDLTRDELNYGIPKKRLYGHSHFVSDVVLSSDGNYALSGSWDKTLRLWDLAAGRTTRRFEDHTKVQYLKLFFYLFFFFIMSRSFTTW